MPEKLRAPMNGENDSAQKKLPETDPAEDGRSKEWQDRSRVNLETVPEDTTTNIERDFEPENLDDEDTSKNNKDNSVY